MKDNLERFFIFLFNGNERFVHANGNGNGNGNEKGRSMLIHGIRGANQLIFIISLLETIINLVEASGVTILQS